MKWPGKKRVAIFAGGVALVLAGVFAFVTRPQLLDYSGGLKTFDGRFKGYSLDDARTLLEALGPDGIAYYSRVQLPLDMIFPLAYALALGFSIIHLQRGVARSQNRVTATLRSVIYSAPFLAAIFDYWENWLVWRMLNLGSQDVTKALVEEASRTTTYKWVFVAIAVAGLFLSFLYSALGSRRGSG